MSEFQSDPRNYALELVSNGLVSGEHLALCCLKYMSHDDVRDMLNANELGPNECDECGDECENADDELCSDCQEKHNLEEYIEEFKGTHDVEAMRIDIENGNLKVGDDASDYDYENIVETSIANGQFDQAKRQCESYGLDYTDYVD